MSPETWRSTVGGDVVVDELVARVRSTVAAEHLDGVSISGGEPTEQPGALEALLSGLQPLRLAQVDILLFSGLTVDQFRRRHGALLGLVDAAVIGPYLPNSSGRAPLLASGNQRLLQCSDLGHARYPDRVDLAPTRIQITPDPTGVTLVGLPRRGDVDRLRADLAGADVAVSG